MNTENFHLIYLYQDTRFQNFLSQFPHKLSDQMGNPLSTLSEEFLTNEVDHEISLPDKKSVGTLSCNQEDLAFLSTYVEHELKRFLDAETLPYYEKIALLLQEDIEGLFFSLTESGTQLKKILERTAYLLKSVLLLETVVFFSLDEDSSLRLVAGISPEGPLRENPDVQDEALRIALHAFKNRGPTICHDAEKDEVARSFQNRIKSKNFASFPILFNGEIIGALCLLNKLDHGFESEDLNTIQRFLPVLSQVMGTTYIETSMESIRKTSSHLSRYLSKRIVKNIELAGSGELGGVQKHVVVLFSDIRSFTSLSEGLNPSLLVSLLNYYFDKMGTIIEKYKGTLDKLVGDLVMVVWNIPNDQPDPEFLAVKTAVEMQKVVKRDVVPYWKDQGVAHPFGVGIGINSGPAVVGNLGSSHFMNYTVIGDTINTAQRLEAKAGAGEIWLSDSVWKKVDGKVPKADRIEQNIQLKGKEKAATAHVLIPKW